MLLRVVAKITNQFGWGVSYCLVMIPGKFLLALAIGAGFRIGTRRGEGSLLIFVCYL